MNEKVRNNMNNVIPFNEKWCRASNLLTLASQIKGYKLNTMTREIAGKVVVFCSAQDVFANAHQPNNESGEKFQIVPKID